MTVIQEMDHLEKQMAEYSSKDNDERSFFKSLIIKNPKYLILKLIFIFIPTFLIAILVDKMVYVLPTLAVGLLQRMNESRKTLLKKQITSAKRRLRMRFLVIRSRYEVLCLWLKVSKNKEIFL